MTSEFELGYIVALLEGEGCFMLINNSSASIRLTMTDRDTVERAALIMNVNYNKIATRYTKNEKHNTQYAFGVYGREAMRWMRIVRPYMSERRGNKIDQIINTIIIRKPFYELGEDFCPRAGHSIEYPWEYRTNGSDGGRICKRCEGSKIKRPVIIPDNPDPNYVFVNPFLKKSS